MVAMPPIADMLLHSSKQRFVPGATFMQCSKCHGKQAATTTQAPVRGDERLLLILMFTS